MRDLLYRLCVLFTNFFFPPFAVAMLSGFSTDTLINCALLLLAIIPSHIHGFYLSCVYFHRRSKVKKGRYPGGTKSFIYSPSILNGGYSDAVVDELYHHKKASAKRGSQYRQSYRVEPSNHEADASQRLSYRSGYGTDSAASSRNARRGSRLGCESSQRCPQY